MLLFFPSYQSIWYFICQFAETITNTSEPLNAKTTIVLLFDIITIFIQDLLYHMFKFHYSFK